MPASKKPFRKILPTACPPTHFTVEEARRAVREVMAERGYDPIEAERIARASAYEEEGEGPDARDAAA